MGDHSSGGSDLHNRIKAHIFGSSVDREPEVTPTACDGGGYRKCPPPAPSNYLEFTAPVIQGIDEDLKKRDVEDLKFLCSELISETQLEKCTRGLDIFGELQYQGYISRQDGALLIELLVYIGKLKKVRQLGMDPYKFRQSLLMYGGKLPAYRVLLWKFCEEVGKDEFSTLKYFAKEYGVSKQELESAESMTSLFKTMEERGILAPLETEVMMDMAMCLKRQDLIDLVAQYQANPGLPPTYTRADNLYNGGLTGPAPPAGGGKPLPYYEITDAGSPLINSPFNSNQPPPYSPQPLSEEETLSGAGAVHNFYREKQNLMMMMPDYPLPTPRTVPQVVDLPQYKMDSIPRGYAVIINNRDFYHVPSDPASKKFLDREGTEVDVRNLEYIWKKLKFDVKTYSNLTDSEIYRLMVEYGMTPENPKGNRKDHSNKDCFVCCILSHGTIGGIYGVNGKLVPIKDITNTFKPGMCPGLIDKPKLFFIQACLGTDKQKGAGVGNNIQEDSGGLNVVETIPNEADFLLGYSTTPGFVSYRSKDQGSWYITKLVQMLDEHAHRYDLMSILVLVNEEVGKAVAQVESKEYKQSPAPLVTLRKRVVFY